MLSAFSNFLPSAISEKLEKFDVRQQQQQQQQQQDADQGKEETGKKEKKKKSTTNENFIIVRPPPAKTNHPLNLQVQLVPAHTQKSTPERSSTAQSFSSTATTEAALQRPPSPSESDPGHVIRRSPSNRSNRSAFYSNASTSSVVSFASSASTATSGRRMIIPLYNLHAHNVMTNTILDAGTDARVAKFHKRGLELIDLGVLEPQEIWVPKAGVPHPSEAPPEGITRTTSRNSLAPPAMHSATAAAGGAVTPDPSQSPSSSRLSLSSERGGGSHTDLPAQYAYASGQVVVVPATPTAPASTGAKKLFGKIFRKKSPARGERSSEGARTPSAQAQQQETALSPVSPTPSRLSHVSSQAQPPLLLVDSPAATPMHTPQPSYDSHHAHAPPPHPSHGHAPAIPLPSILGLTPTLHPTSPSPHPLISTSPPRSSTHRTFKIIWTLKKWVKEPEGEGSPAGLAGMLGKVAAHAQGHSGENGSGGWEVRWEWVRGGEKEKRREERKRRGSAVGQATVPAAESGKRTSVVLGEEDGVAVLVESPRGSLDRSRSLGAAQKKHKKRMSLGGGTEDMTVTDEKGGAGGEEEDGTEDGYESDPEDSETPWTCSLVVQHMSPPVQGHGQATSGTPSRRHSRDVSSAHGHPGTTSSTLSATSAYAPASPMTKIKIATLSPAPHHPKVVCQLRIPFPLPDVQVSKGAVCKRVVLPDGSTRTTVGTGSPIGVVLTAEEIKDVVCSTACWLVVREGIGGVGKVNRKGDGWRIRG